MPNWFRLRRAMTGLIPPLIMYRSPAKKVLEGVLYPNELMINLRHPDLEMGDSSLLDGKNLNRWTSWAGHSNPGRRILKSNRSPHFPAESPSCMRNCSSFVPFAIGPG